MQYDVLVLGAGPGGYVAAIRAAQLGKSVVVVERAELGGVCLNWGCIPTKSLLKSAEVYMNIKNARSYGIELSVDAKPDFAKVIDRSRRIAMQMSKGIEFLFKKNNITVVTGSGSITADKKVRVLAADGTEQIISATNIILATGAQARALPQLPIDGQRVLGYREVLTLKTLPETLLVVGSGAIGVELAYFYACMGSKVTLVEHQAQIAPLLQANIAEQLEKGLKKVGIKIITGAQAELISISDTDCVCKITTAAGSSEITTTCVLSATGVVANIANIGLEAVGVAVKSGRIEVNERYQTSVAGIWAIGDIINTPALAHVAQAEGVACAEHIAGHAAAAVNYLAIPSCIYTQPEVAAVGMSATEAQTKGIAFETGQFPFSALGKATATGNREGFASLTFNKQTGQLLGAQIVGHGITELIAELTLAINAGLGARDILHSVHAHPSMSEAIAEAAAQFLGECVHL